MTTSTSDDEYRVALIAAMNVALATLSAIESLPQQSTGWRPESALPYPKQVIIDSLVLLYSTSRPGRSGMRARVERVLGPEEAEAVFTKTFRANVRNALLSLPAFVPDEDARLCSSWEDVFFAKLAARQTPPPPPAIYSAAKRREEEERAQLRSLVGLPPKEAKRPSPPVEPSPAVSTNRGPSSGCAVIVGLLPIMVAAVAAFVVSLLRLS